MNKRQSIMQELKFENSKEIIQFICLNCPVYKSGCFDESFYESFYRKYERDINLIWLTEACYLDRIVQIKELMKKDFDKFAEKNIELIKRIVETAEQQDGMNLDFYKKLFVCSFGDFLNAVPENKVYDESKIGFHYIDGQMLNKK